MTNAASIAQAARRFIDADHNHAIAQAKASTTAAASERMAQNRAAYRHGRPSI